MVYLSILEANVDSQHTSETCLHFVSIYRTRFVLNLSNIRNKFEHSQ